MTDASARQGDAAFDLVVRGGMVIDGSGGPPFRGDVAVRDGRIVKIGWVDHAGAREIAADGLAVAPGFIDSHTHFDAQLCWDPDLQPALEHGVTTVVTGNCSLSLAPVRPDQRQRLGRMFRRIEDVPQSALNEGVGWEWESFKQYLQSLTLGINITPLVGHSQIHMWIMGEEAATRGATGEEIAGMRELLAQCLDDGAVGMSTSYVDVDENLRPVPSRLATTEEMRALCATLGGQAAPGVLQTVPEFGSLTPFLSRMDFLAQLSIDCGIAVVTTPLNVTSPRSPVAPGVVARVEDWSRRGARLWPQSHPRPVELNFQLDNHSFLTAGPTWLEVVNLATREEQKAAYADPATRSRLVDEARSVSRPAHDGTDDMAFLRGSEWRFAAAVVRGVGNPALGDHLGKSVGDIAAERGVSATEALIDIALADNLDTEFKNLAVGHADPDAVGWLMTHPNVQVGASDGGAHVRSFATYGDTGYLFSAFVRRHRLLSAPQAVRRLSYDVARVWGLHDRGLLSPGYAADLVVFDPTTFDRGDEVRADDLPGGGWRYVRGQRGMHAVVVNGAVAWTAAHGYTGARAGAVVTAR